MGITFVDDHGSRINHTYNGSVRTITVDCTVDFAVIIAMLNHAQSTKVFAYHIAGKLH